MRFEPGRLVLHRNMRFGRIGSLRPCRVVLDDDRGLLLWLARGSTVVNEVTTDGRGMRTMSFAEWLRHDYRPQAGIWQGPGILKFLPPGAEHSVWWFFTDAGDFAGWYVNLEEHGVRWDDGEAAGVDIVDQDLDIMVQPDRRWAWKDEDEFTERLAFPGDYWVADEAAVRAEGRRVVRQIEAGEFPFDGTWCDYRPDPSWPVTTTLPAGWDRPQAAR